jgi:hypothetical protein
MGDVVVMNGRSKGLIAGMLDWFHHPRFTDKDPIDWLAFAVLLTLAGLLWSKVVKQTLDATIETVEEIAA